MEAAGRIVTDVPADLDTPVGAFLKLRPVGARFLLESAETGGTLGRYSLVGFGDTELVSSGENSLTIRGPAGTRAIRVEDPLLALRGILEARGLPRDPAPPLLGGVVGYLAYETVRLLEKLPSRCASSWPLFHFLLVDGLVVYDHLAHRASVMTIVTERGEEAARARNERIRDALAGAPPTDPGRAGRRPLFRGCDDGLEYAGKVDRAKRYIRSGDVFQVVLSRREETTITADPFRIYRALRMGNPSPYMFYLDFGERKLVGSSPEMVVKMTGGRARISPIAGTRPRGVTPVEDEALASELLADEKERAEHVMLVDLARNDLGRVCRYGTVEVPRLMRVEKYSHVQHIVSDVTGRIRPGLDGLALLRACFPAGTVTGAPKIRAMKIIDALEEAGRGPYGGCVGYLSPGGDMDTCLAIRTVFVEGDTAVLQAGAGIVADSDPMKEYEETRNKLAALREAVVAAEEGRL
ncbi:MAG: anthranilate synthase component I family protein [Planctomycetota bacterium]